MAGNERLIQQDWSAGMFRSVAPELIPDSGAYDIVNGLLSIDGSIFRRGGTSWYTPNVGFGTRVTLLWDGYLTNGGKTTVAGDKDFYGEIPQGGGDPFGTFGSGTGNTQPTRGVGYNGVLYLPNGHTYDGTTYTTMGTAVAIQPFYAVVSDRLLAAGGNRVYFSAIGDPTTWDPTDYWDMPDGCKIIGLQGLRDACLVFTTVGVFAISGLTQNLTDADGNTQQRLDRYSQEIVLWSDASIAAWAGGLVVASNDGVYIIHLGVASEAPQQFERISDPVSQPVPRVRRRRLPGGRRGRPSGPLLPADPRPGLHRRRPRLPAGHAGPPVDPPVGVRRPGVGVRRDAGPDHAAADVAGRRAERQGHALQLLHAVVDDAA
jgi:hypothetical protein